jgi:hypothetical protein
VSLLWLGSRSGCCCVSRLLSRSLLVDVGSVVRRNPFGGCAVWRFMPFTDPACCGLALAGLVGVVGVCVIAGGKALRLSVVTFWAMLLPGDCL